MECEKCKAEISSEDKFCSKCGTKKVEKSLSEWHKEAHESTTRLWFLIGFLRGSCANNKKDKAMIEKLNMNVMKNSPLIYEEYENVIKFWRDYASLNVDSETKEAIRPKRVSVRKTKTVQKDKK